MGGGVRGVEQRLVGRCQEQVISFHSRTAAGPAHPLEKTAHRRRGVDLDGPVEIAHVDAQFQNAGGHDDAVFAFRECLFGPPPLVGAQGTVGHEDRDIPPPEFSPETLGLGPAVREDQPFFAPVEAGYDNGGIVQGSDEIDSHIRRKTAAVLFGRLLDLIGPLAAAPEPTGQPIRIAHRGRQADALNLTSGDPGYPLQHRQKMPSPVVAGKGVDFIDDDHFHIGQKGSVVHLSGGQHHFEGFRRGQQAVGRVPRNVLSGRGRDVAVPKSGMATDQSEIAVETDVQVVQQGLDGADIEHGEPPPVFVQHPGQDRKQGRFGLAAGGGGHHQHMPAAKDGPDDRFLEGSQLGPAEAVDDVVLECRVEEIELTLHLFQVHRPILPCL